MVGRLLNGLSANTGSQCLGLTVLSTVAGTALVYQIVGPLDPLRSGKTDNGATMEVRGTTMEDAIGSTVTDMEEDNDKAREYISSSDSWYR